MSLERNGDQVALELQWQDENVPDDYDAPPPTSLGYYHPIGSELHTHFVLIYSEILTEYPLCVRDSESGEGHKG